MRKQRRTDLCDRVLIRFFCSRARRCGGEKAKRTAGNCGLTTTYESNRNVVMALGAQLVAMRGHGLAAFRPCQRLLPLTNGERREFVKCQGPFSGTEEWRSVLVAADGARRWGVPRKFVGNGISLPARHQCCDMSAASWHGASAVVHNIGLRSTLNFDRSH